MFCCQPTTLALVTVLASCSKTPDALPAPEPCPQRVLTGLDVLCAQDFEAIAGAKVGLVSNHTGLSGEGQSIVDILRATDRCELRALFSPEHGFAGNLDQEDIGNDRHRSGLSIHSLYGNDRKPSAASLRGLDTLVFDIQDIGCRFYTYISTMLLCMEAAAEQGLRFVVLDRPNPIGGLAVAGPVLDNGLESFVGCHKLPVRHGMTIGELARMLATERNLACDLQVVTMKGWRRTMQHQQTGLTWVDPSPNMRSHHAALLYPGVGLLEMTNLSVGRGTPTPFEVFGAPWIDGQSLAKRIGRAALPGLRIEAIRFTPDQSKHAGQECSGIRFTITDPIRFEPLRLGMELACALRDMHAEHWDMDPLQRLLGDEATLAGLRSGQTAASLVTLWTQELDAFRRRRAHYLLYP